MCVQHVCLICMHMCVCVHMRCECVYACIYVHMCVCLHAYVFIVFLCVIVCTWECVPVCSCVCVHVVCESCAESILQIHPFSNVECKNLVHGLLIYELKNPDLSLFFNFNKKKLCFCFRKLNKYLF